jgi:hypothetical protein
MNRKSLPGAEHNSAKKKNSGAFEITPAHQLARRFITREREGGLGVSDL